MTDVRNLLGRIGVGVTVLGTVLLVAATATASAQTRGVGPMGGGGGVGGRLFRSGPSTRSASP